VRRVSIDSSRLRSDANPRVQNGPSPDGLLYLGAVRHVRRTQATVRVLSALVDEPLDRHWGYDLQKRASVRSGVLYPILQRLLEAGWLEDGWEDPSEIDRGRPPRRYYVLTADGHAAARGVLADAAREPRFGWLGTGVNA
jgi:PadR family transcriptional regulator, regulatory protein PadR